MSKYSYSGQGFEIKTNFSFKDIETAGKPAAKKSITKLAIAIEGQAVLLSPWKEGRLRDSITYSIEGQTSDTKGKAQAGDGVHTSLEPLTAVIGTNVEYAPYQEFGTSRQGYAQPFLRPAFDLMTGSRTKREVSQAMNEELRKKGIKSK